MTDYGIIGYTGPCPPQGETHRYQFKVYGLDAMLALPAGLDKHALVAAMKGHVLQFGRDCRTLVPGKTPREGPQVPGLSQVEKLPL